MSKTTKASKHEHNVMQKVFIEKVVLSCGGTKDDLTKAKKLLEFITKRKAQIVASQKRIPDFGVSPGLEVGAVVTLRGEEATRILKQLLGGVDNTIKEKQVAENHLSFGIKEYIEVPGLAYQREIGIRGLNVTIVFARKGLRVKRKKIKRGKVPARQHVKEEEIIAFMKENFQTGVM
jgi:large subunit ribosomal protein L5